MSHTVELPEGVTASMDIATLTLKGAKGESARDFMNPQVGLTIKDNSVEIKTKRSTKRDKMLLGTFKAHILNMIQGVTEGHHYELKICSSHFPMNVSIAGKKFIIKNFIGEKFPRKITILEGADVKIEGTAIMVKSVSKEVAGQQSALIEEGCKRPGFDKRIFQDGIYIVNKDGKSMGQ